MISYIVAILLSFVIFHSYFYYQAKAKNISPVVFSTIIFCVLVMGNSFFKFNQISDFLNKDEVSITIQTDYPDLLNKNILELKEVKSSFIPFASIDQIKTFLPIKSSLLDLIIRFLLNLGSVAILLFLLYYPRYKHKETTIAGALFNIFAFAVLSVLSSVEFSIAAGFGLFAVLALFNLRSEQINKSDIAYYFGSVSIAVITSVSGTDLTFVMLMLFIVLVAVYIIDHPQILRTVSQMKLTLDYIPDNFVSNPEILIEELSARLGVEILAIRVKSVCYVTEVIQIEIDFRVSK